MYYIHYYTSQSAHTEDYKRWSGGDKYEEPWVDLVAETEEVHYDIPEDWTNALKFRALDNGTFRFSLTVSYSLDGGETWTELPPNTDSPIVESGKYIMWKGELAPSINGIGTFSSSGRYDAMGCPYSLLNNGHTLASLFKGSTGLVSAKDLMLPASELTMNCYARMFSGCTQLNEAPELPATKMAGVCYEGMFAGCKQLNEAPELPATKMAYSCYHKMFEGCTSLRVSPDLPAMELASGCYEEMFSGCTALSTAPSILPATKLYERCYRSMFRTCTSLWTAPILPAEELVTNCYATMFSG